jgi:transcriptional regulator with XRE-family HTH domain
MRDESGAAIERLDTAGLGQMLRERRGSLSLRKAADEAGVSFSTFARVEDGAQPDLVSFTKLCAWLGLSPSQFFAPVAARRQDAVEVAVAHLHADPRLKSAHADTIADMLRKMYEALAEPIRDAPTVACHLRASTTLRPGVAERLSGLLQSLESELQSRITAGVL